MKPSIARLFVVIFVLATSAWLVWLKWPRHEDIKPHSEFPAIAMIATERPHRRDFSARLHWFGKVESKRTVTIEALTPGRIKAVKVADASFVEQGEKLFTLGGSRIGHRIKSLRRRVAALEKQASFARGVVRTRRKSVAEKMMKREELLAAQERLARLAGEVSAAKQESAVLQDALLVRSPMVGIFTNRRVSAGQEVDQGTSLADVISKDLRITASCSPASGISLEGRVATIQASRGAAISGMITKTLPVRTPEGLTVVWIESGGINRFMKPGEITSGSIALETRKDALAVPKGAVVRDENEDTFVFVNTSQGYQRKAVTIGLAEGGWLEIVSGISGKDKVVVRGAYELFHRDFDKVYKVAD